MLPRAATDFYALQQRVNFTAASEIRRLWRSMGDDFDASWRRVGPAILAVLIEAQQAMAEAALDYVPAVLAETDIPDQPSGDMRPGAFVGRASDGRRLDTLAYGAVTHAKTAAVDGAATSAALDSGGDWLDLMARLQVADAARQAVGVMTVSRKNLGGTVRVLNPPSCQRCAILAGRWYRWSKGFDRHPQCDCVNQPVPSESYAKAEGFLTEPMTAYRNGDIKDLTKGQRFAIDHGADISQVVNVKRGMSTTDIGTAIRVLGPIRPGQPDLIGLLSNLPRAVGTRETRRRMAPEAIYRTARGDRAKAIALLRENGYIT